MLKAPPVMVVSASTIKVSVKAPKPRELEATDPPSAKQENFPVEISQFKVLPSASQSPKAPPATLGSQNADAEAYPLASKLREVVALFEMVIASPVETAKVLNFPVAASKVAVPEAFKRPVISLPLPVINPPRVKSLIVKVPVELEIVLAFKVAVSKIPDVLA